MTEETPHRRHWTFNQEISIPSVISLIAAIAAIFGAYSALDTRISLLEQATISEARHTDEWRARMDLSIDEIGRKLDRITETRK